MQSVKYIGGQQELILANYQNFLGLISLENDTVSKENLMDSLQCIYRSNRNIEYVAVSDDYQFLGLCLEGDRSITVSVMF